MVIILASEPSCTRFDCQRSRKKIQRKIMYFPEVNQQRWLEESRQWLENVDRTHLVLASTLLASGQPVIQKSKSIWTSLMVFQDLKRFVTDCQRQSQPQSHIIRPSALFILSIEFRFSLAPSTSFRSSWTTWRTAPRWRPTRSSASSSLQPPSPRSAPTSSPSTCRSAEMTWSSGTLTPSSMVQSF